MRKINKNLFQKKESLKKEKKNIRFSNLHEQENLIFFN